MEKNGPNWPASEDAEKTIVVASSGNVGDAADEDLVSALPLKSQERYKFVRSIGFGGMKGVLLVYDRDTRRDVAMAIMPDFRERPRADLNRFVREAQITAQLEHPNIVPVHDIGIDRSGSPFFTMKYLRGSTLGKVLRRLRSGDAETVAAFSQARLLQIFMRVCNAVAFAHSQGYCHLDLKPSNIHCGDFGEVQVLDWGIAAPVGSPIPCGTVIGTPGYLAPEMIADQERFATPAADIYALGAILYAILTLDAPYAGTSRQEILKLTLTDRPKPLAAFNVPAGLAAICEKAMAKDPAMRYKDAKELRQEITASLSGFAAKAENASLWRTGFLFLRRHIYWVVIVILLLAAILMGLQLRFYRKIYKADQRRNTEEMRNVR